MPSTFLLRITPEQVNSVRFIKSKNRLYNHVSLCLGKRQTDKQGATSHVVQYLTAEALVSSIEANDETKNAELQLRDFIRQHTYHFVLVGDQFQPSDADDNALLTEVEQIAAGNAGRHFQFPDCVGIHPL